MNYTLVTGICCSTMFSRTQIRNMSKDILKDICKNNMIDNNGSKPEIMKRMVDCGLVKTKVNKGEKDEIIVVKTLLQKQKDIDYLVSIFGSCAVKGIRLQLLRFKIV